MFYWFLKWIAIGPLLRVVFRPRVSGSENVPDEGPAILASNHLSYADWLFMPLTLPRRVTFVAKAEYFNSPGHQGLVPEAVLLRCRPGADRPLRCVRGRGCADRGQAGARGGRAVRHLPRGHPVARRPALPRQDRRRPAGARDRRPGDPRRRRRHRRGRAARQEVRQLHPADRALRQAAGLLALRGPGERPLHPAVDHRRDHVRDHAALRPGVRRQYASVAKEEQKKADQKKADPSPAGRRDRREHAGPDAKAS